MGSGVLKLTGFMKHLPFFMSFKQNVSEKQESWECNHHYKPAKTRFHHLDLINTQNRTFSEFVSLSFPEPIMET